MTDKRMEYIREQLSQGELLAQLAEEAAELAQAALKLRRVYDGRNPTPAKAKEAYDNLIEEIGDVWLLLDVLCFDYPLHEINLATAAKLERWCSRLKAAAEVDRKLKAALEVE